MPQTVEARPVRSAYRHKCGARSVLPSTLALNLAKDPKRYATLFCSGCKTYLSASEFTWEQDGKTVGT